MLCVPISDLFKQCHKRQQIQSTREAGPAFTHGLHGQGKAVLARDGPGSRTHASMSVPPEGKRPQPTPLTNPNDRSSPIAVTTYLLLKALVKRCPEDKALFLQRKKSPKVKLCSPSVSSDRDLLIFCRVSSAFSLNSTNSSSDGKGLFVELTKS